MIDALTPENYKLINKVSILDAKKVFYPLKYVLEKRDISFDDDQALQIIPLPEDLRYPSNSKITDSGKLIDYQIKLSINNQFAKTQTELERLDNCKVIVVLHHNYGRIIIGCNEMPLDYWFDEENTQNPQEYNGYTVTCRGNAYFLKVST